MAALSSTVRGRPARVARRVARPWRDRLAASRTRQLAASDDPAARAIGEAILAAERQDISSEETTWIRRIEALRAEMTASTDPMEESRSEFTGDPADDGARSVRALGELTRTSSKPPRWAFLLLRIVRAFAPSRGLELGTCVAISAAYQGAGLALNGHGRLLTLEAVGSRVRRARQNLMALDLGTVEVLPGPFQTTLPAALERLEPLDYAFVDGHHDEHATVSYFDAIASSCATDAVLVFDDIRWSAGMKRAWRTITADDRIRLAVAIDNVGVCVLGRERPKQVLTVPVDERRWASPLRL